MRKVKAIHVLAAAIAAVPGSMLLADDGSAVPSRARVERPVNRDNSWQADYSSLFSAGKFTLHRSAPLAGGPDADVNATWIGPDEGAWSNTANWDVGQVPDGPNAIANITNYNDGGVVAVDGTFTLSQINISDPQLGAILGPTAGGTGTLNFTNARTINTTAFPLQVSGFTGRFFGTAFGVQAGSATPARPINITGSSGLNVTGGPISFRANNSYTGDTTISGGAYVTVLPQATLNGAFGSNNANAVILNNGEIWAEIDNGVMDRPIQIASGGGTLLLGTDPAAAAITTHTFNGVISNSGAPGALVVDNRFGGNGVFAGNNTYTGNLRFMGLGTNVLQNSAFASVASIRNGGTIELLGTGNKINDAATVTQHGGGIRLFGTETIGTLNVPTGVPAILLIPPLGGGNANSTLTINNYVRGAGTGLEVRANNLGSNSRVFIGNGASLVTNGIIKFAYGSSADPFTSGAESNLTELVTYNAVTGVTPLSQAGGYAENTFTAGANVRLQSDTVNQAFAAPAVTINSLTLAPGFDNDGNGVNGVTVNGGPITVTSGTVLSATSGFLTTNAINSGTGNIINAPLNFGANEAVMLTPGALTINGAISGTGGLTKQGGRTLFMNATNSTYTGTTTLSSFNRHKGNLILNAPSAYGQDPSNIILHPADRTQQDPQQGATSIPFVSFGPDAGQGATSMTRGLTLRAGGNDEVISALIRNFSTGAFTMAGPITVEANTDLVLQSLAGANQPYIVSGNISGAGHVSAGATQVTLDVTLSGNNTYTGGFDIGSGLNNTGTVTIRANSDSAFGTGLVTVTLDGVADMIANAPRTIANPILLDGGTFQIGGTQPWTFNGPITLRPSGFPASIVTVVGNNSATFSGTLQQGTLFKQGTGTLHLSGNNTHDGFINVGNGTIAGGMVILRSNGALGTSVGGMGANFGENAIGLTGGITVGLPDPILGTNGETAVIRGEGISNLGAIRNLSGNNTWRGNVAIQQQGTGTAALTTKGSIGVDNAGESLTITGAVFTSSVDSAGGTANLLGFRKVGPGTLFVGRDSFSSGTTTFNGSVLTSGSFEISTGTVRLTNQGTPPGNNVPSVADVAAISIAGGPTTPTARLDMGRNAMVVDYTGASPLSDIQSLINAGRAGGAWTGNGITSSNLAGLDQSRVNLFAFDTAVTGTGPTSTFLGDPIDSTAVLVFPALNGDANLDWRVNLLDFNALAANFNQTNRIWTQGNFNGDNIVNLADFNILAGNFGFAAGPDGPTPEDWTTLASLVPEPSSLSLVGLAGLGMLKRRRNRR